MVLATMRSMTDAEIYGSVGELRGMSFRLGTVGVISDEDVRGFIGSLDALVSSGSAKD